MNGPDFEGVLAGHPQENARPKHHDGDPWKYDGTYVCACGEEFKAAPGIGGVFRGHRAHVAAVLREQIAAAQAEAWDEALFAVCVDNGIVYDIGMRPTNPYRAAQVAPSRVPGEGS